MFDELSGVYRVRPADEQGHEKVLHRNNLRPWGKVYVDAAGIERKESEGGMRRNKM